MTTLDWPTFVLQRRINEPIAAVEQVVCEPRLLRPGAAFDLDDAGTVLALDRSFGVTFPPFGVDGTSWCTTAAIVTPHGRAVERFELEINIWDAASTELLVRPRAKHPDRWSARRLRRYFDVAHATADVLTSFIGGEARRVGIVVAPDFATMPRGH